MAYNVNFLKGTAQSFADLAVKSKNTFYYIDEKDLYIGDVKLTNGADLAAAIVDISKNKGDIEIIKAQIEDLTGTGGEGDSSLTELISNLNIKLLEVEEDLDSEISRSTAKDNEFAANLEEISGDLSALSTLVNNNETDIETKFENLNLAVQTNTENLESNSNLAISTAEKVEDQATAITTIQGDISELEGIVDTLVGSDASKSVRAIAIEVLAEQLLADGMTENFASLQELAAWLADHPEEAADMNAAIQANATAIAGLQTTVGSHTTSIEGMLQVLQGIQDETTGVLALSKGYTDTEVQKVANELTTYKNNNEVVFSGINSALESTSNSLSQAQAQLAELQKNLGTAAYKAVEDFDAAGSAAAALAEAKAHAEAYTDAALTWGNIQ